MFIEMPFGIERLPFKYYVATAFIDAQFGKLPRNLALCAYYVQHMISYF